MEWLFEMTIASSKGLTTLREPVKVVESLTKVKLVSVW